MTQSAPSKGDKNLGAGDLDTKITTGDHDTVGLLENLVKVLDTLVVLDLADNLDVLALLAQNLADITDILSTADEGGKDDIDVVLDTKEKIILVLLGEGGQIDISLGEVDTLARADLAVVDSLDLDVGAVDLEDPEGENTVVDIDDLAGGDDLGEVLVVDIHVVSCASLGVLVVSGDDHLVAGGDGDFDVVLHQSCADLRALGVESNTDGASRVN
jgi:hypothetical protein